MDDAQREELANNLVNIGKKMDSLTYRIRAYLNPRVFLFLALFLYSIAILNAIDENFSGDVLFFSHLWAVAGTVCLILHWMMNRGWIQPADP